MLSALRGLLRPRLKEAEAEAAVEALSGMLLKHRAQHGAWPPRDSSWLWVNVWFDIAGRRKRHRDLLAVGRAAAERAADLQLRDPELGHRLIEEDEHLDRRLDRRSFHRAPVAQPWRAGERETEPDPSVTVRVGSTGMAGR